MNHLARALLQRCPVDPGRGRLRPGLVVLASSALAISLSSCQTQPIPTADAATQTTQALTSDRSVVGRLELHEDGAPVRTGLLSKLGDAAFIAAPRGTDRGVWLDVSNDGTLSWKLAPGEYDLVALRLVGGKGTSILPINGQLTVAADRPVTDIGVIRGETGSYGARVRQIEPVSKSAAQPGEQVDNPGSPFVLRRLSVGTYARVVDVCASRWFLQCTRSFNGVVAVEPAVDFELRGSVAARASSLQPKFSWRATVGGVYDLVVWRAIGYKPNALAATQHVVGPVVFYVEGLEQPEFTSIPALQPATRYFWSVRMRQGDTVSTWSTTGHFTFLLVAATSSSGRMFEFETP